MSFSTTSTNAILGLPLHIFIHSFNLTQLTFPHWCRNLSLLCTRPNHLKQLSFHLSSIGVILIFKWVFSSWILYFLLFLLIHLNIFMSITLILWICYLTTKYFPYVFLNFIFFTHLALILWFTSFSISQSLWIIDPRYQKLSLFGIS